MRLACVLAAVLTLAACGGDDATPPPVDAAVRPAWQPGLPAAAALGVRRGLTPVRGIIHLHSPFSHDACDGNPRPGPDGAIDEACLAHLRAALCTLHIGYAALTDHDDSMADEAFATLFSQRADDELVMSGGGRLKAMNFLDIATAFGADASIAKPFTPAQLRASVEALLYTADRRR